MLSLQSDLCLLTRKSQYVLSFATQGFGIDNIERCLFPTDICLTELKTGEVNALPDSSGPLPQHRALLPPLSSLVIQYDTLGAAESSIVPAGFASHSFPLYYSSHFEVEGRLGLESECMECSKTLVPVIRKCQQFF